MNLFYKIIAITFYLLSFAKATNAQEVKVVVFEGISLLDELIVGFNDEATMGVDEELGEMDIFDTPISDPEIRVLQRDESNFNCAYTYSVIEPGVFGDTTPIYHEIVFDSKINFRPLPIDSINKFFEIGFFGNLSDINTSIVSTTSTPLNEIIDAIYLEADSCKGYSLVYKISEWPFPIHELSFALQPINLLIAFQEDIIDNTFSVATEDSFKIFPNPAKDVLYLANFEKRKNPEYSIFDIQGREIQQGILTKSAINTHRLPDGIYFIKITDASFSSTQKFQIQR